MKLYIIAFNITCNDDSRYEPNVDIRCYASYEEVKKRYEELTSSEEKRHELLLKIHPYLKDCHKSIIDEFCLCDFIIQKTEFDIMVDE